MSGRTLTAACVQVAPVLFDRDAAVEKAVAGIEEAAAHGARVVAFPETWVTGYPAWIFGAAGWEDARAKRAYARFLEHAVVVPGPATDRLCAAAAAGGSEVCIGINERDPGGGTIYNSQLFIGADGGIRGVHRKLVPTHAERIVWGQGDGSTLSVFDTPVGRIGGLVCWEHWMPLARFAMHAQGEQIHVAAWPEAPDIHHLASRHYAFEGRCFVLCAATFMRRSDVPAGFELADAVGETGQFGDDPAVLLPGGSGIIGPDSEWIAGPVANCETIVYGELDLDRLAQEQQSLDTAGHYNRPDVFQLTVDRRARPAVTWRSAE
jgi:predicted amidohydrolase